ncbi:hypothetical protein K474DRAFT_1703944 [Panus rudis PR-1116 ss-1]|nr:hypothetical protein K474DRAFT_1703944 [Panus rudis PR-1116 ss-1]
MPPPLHILLSLMDPITSIDEKYYRKLIHDELLALLTILPHLPDEPAAPLSEQNHAPPHPVSPAQHNNPIPEPQANDPSLEIALQAAQAIGDPCNPQLNLPEQVIERMLAYRRRERHPKKMSEQAALSVLMQKYQNAMDWQPLLGPISAPVPTNGQIKAHSLNADAMASPLERLTCRLRNITRIGHAQLGHDFVLHMYAAIEDLKWCTDWNILVGKAGVATKTLYTKRWFVRELHPLEDENTSIAKINKEYAKEYRLWRRHFDYPVKGRNRLWTIYHMFGASIFLDPFWCSTNLMDNHRTAGFAQVIEEIAGYVTHPFEFGHSRLELHTAALSVLLSLAAALNADVDFIQDFFDNYPPLVLH